MESDWSQLPKDILETISDRLSNLIDHVRFRAVCKTWASTSPPSRAPHQMPWILLPYNQKTSKRTFLSISENKYYDFESTEFTGKRCCGSCFGWLVLVDGSPNISLLNPLTDEKILLPKLTELPEILCYNERDEEYLYQDSKGLLYNVDMEFIRNFFIHRVILSKNPSTGCNNCWAVLCYDIREYKLAFCKVGDKDNSWTKIEDQPSIYTDMIFHRGKLHATDSTGRFIICDLKSPRNLTAIRPDGVRGPGFMYLAKMEGELLLIMVLANDMEDMDEEAEESYHQALCLGKYHEIYDNEDSDQGRPCINYENRILSLNVFGLDDIGKRLVKINSLGENTLFLSLNCSMCVLAAGIPGCRPNCIYFIDHFSVKRGIYTKRGYELCTFNLKTGAIKPVVSLVLRVPDPRYLTLLDAWFIPTSAANWMSIKSSSISIEDSSIWIPNAKRKPTTELSPVDFIQSRFSFPGPFESKEWKAIKEANLPEYLELLIWRVACGVLPTNINLKNHLFIYTSLCPFCNMEDESLEHLFLSCQFTQVTWLSCLWPLRTSMLNVLKIKDFIHIIVSPDDKLGLHGIEAKKFLVFVAILIDQLWILRNNIEAIRRKTHPLDFALQLNRKYKDFLKDWYSRKPFPSSKWTSPPIGEVKVNFDVAISPNFTMLAVTCRDHEQRFVLAWTEKTSTCDLIICEAKAAFLAVSVALKSGFMNLVLEGSHTAITHPLRFWKTSPHYTISDLICDTRDLLASTESWCVNYVPLRDNMATHKLACWAAFYGRTGSIPMSSLPSCVVYADNNSGPLDSIYKHPLTGHNFVQPPLLPRLPRRNFV